MGDPIVMQAVRDFMKEREWEQFHSPANLAKSIAIESAELLECYQWSETADPAKVQDELADVLTYCLLLSDKLGVEPDDIVLAKLQKTAQKYPVEKARGRSTRYDELSD